MSTSFHWQLYLLVYSTFLLTGSLWSLTDKRPVRGTNVTFSEALGKNCHFALRCVGPKKLNGAFLNGMMSAARRFSLNPKWCATLKTSSNFKIRNCDIRQLEILPLSRWLDLMILSEYSEILEHSICRTGGKMNKWLIMLLSGESASHQVTLCAAKASGSRLYLQNNVPVCANFQSGRRNSTSWIWEAYWYQTTNVVT